MSILLDPYYRDLLLSGLAMTASLSVAVILLSNAAAYGLALYLAGGGGRFRQLIVGYSFFARACPLLALLFALVSLGLRSTIPHDFVTLYTGDNGEELSIAAARNFERFGFAGHGVSGARAGLRSVDPSRSR